MQGVFYQNFHDCAIGHLPIYTRKRTLFHVPIFTTAHFLTVIILHISARRRHNRINLAPIHTAQGGGSFIVGYTAKEAAHGKFLIIGAQFEDVQSGKMPINGLITGVQGVDYDDNSTFVTTAAQIQIPFDGAYKTYYYLNDGYDLVKDDGTTAPGWCDGAGNLVDAEFTPGVAVWFKSVPADGSATVAGAVSDVSYKTVDCPIGFALRANTFPVTVELNTSAITSEDIVGANYDDESQFVNTAPQIQIPYDGAYRTYYYLNDGYDLVKDDGTTAPGWCDGAGNLVNTTIPAGQGFWTKGVTGTFTLKFTK